MFIFFTEIDEFQKIVDTFIGVMERLGKEVEKQKMEAIGAHNVLQSMEKDILTSEQQLQVRFWNIAHMYQLQHFFQF